MKVTNIKRLNKEDFDKEYHSLIDRIAFSINPFMEQVVNAFNKNVDFDNLNQHFMYLEIQVDASGVPTMNSEIKNPLKNRIKGIMCVSVDNLTDTTLLTGAPAVLFTQNNGVITINQVTGLLSGKKYRLSIILIG